MDTKKKATRVTIEELVQHAESLFEDANLEGDCEIHGEGPLVNMGAEPVCQGCLLDYLSNTFRAVDEEFLLLNPPEKKPEISWIPNDMDGMTEQHPSYGHALFCRVTGRTKLFASPLKYHSEYIVLTLSESELRHDLGRDYRHSRKPLIQVAFSSAQFAQLLTTLNVGEGAPCTIQRINNQSIPPVPEQHTTEAGRVKDQFKNDLHTLIAGIQEKQQQVKEILERKSLRKKDRDEVQHLVEKLRRHVEHNVPFMLEQYEKATLRLESAAKAEVEASITAAVEKLGLQKLDELKKALPGHATVAHTLEAGHHGGSSPKKDTTE